MVYQALRPFCYSVYDSLLFLFREHRSLVIFSDHDFAGPGNDFLYLGFHSVVIRTSYNFSKADIVIKRRHGLAGGNEEIVLPAFDVKKSITGRFDKNLALDITHSFGKTVIALLVLYHVAFGKHFLQCRKKALPVVCLQAPSQSEEIGIMISFVAHYFFKFFLHSDHLPSKAKKRTHGNVF